MILVILLAVIASVASIGAAVVARRTLKRTRDLSERLRLLEQDLGVHR
jgi:hypothetical protein